MTFGHLSAGYITSKLLFKEFEHKSVYYKAFMFWGMLGAIAPDIDMLYYFTNKHTFLTHHQYYTHFPIFWLALLLISLFWLQLHHHRNQNPAAAFIFTFNGFIHTILDTVTGEIWWLAPFVNKPFSFVTDRSEFTYFTDWTFGIELFLLLLALSLLNIRLSSDSREN
jgi:hypothetical protein